MAWTPTEDDVKGRIDDLEAMVNGLMIYIAAKEAGVSLDLDSATTKAFIRANILRPKDARLRQKGVKADDGYWDALASARVRELSEKLKAAPL